MPKGHRTVASLLAVIAVLLGLNLTAKEAPAAEAGPAQPAGPTEPHIVSITATTANGIGGPENNLYRLWSDGAVDMWRVLPNSQAPPTWHNFLTGEEGSSAWWGWVPLGPVQRADLNADGCVDVEDFLSLLADWNPCG